MWWHVLLWLVLIVALLCVMLSGAVECWLTVLGRRRVPGSEIVGVAFAPLFIVTALITPLGAVAASLLAALVEQGAGRVTLDVIAGVLVALTVTEVAMTVTFVSRNRAVWREAHRVMTTEEVVGQLRSGAISRLVRNGAGVVRVTYAGRDLSHDRRDAYRAHTGDPAGWDTYLAVAAELAPHYAIECLEFPAPDRRQDD
jgi:hypothetical protein